MGSASISPYEVMGEEAPEVQIPTEETEEMRMAKFLAHQQTIAEREERQQREWFAGLGLVDTVDG